LASRYFFDSDGGGNACYKLTGALGGAKVSGPILVEISKDNNVFQRNRDVESAFDMASIAVIDAQENQRIKP
jgi:phosphotransacetylase